MHDHPELASYTDMAGPQWAVSYIMLAHHHARASSLLEMESSEHFH